MGLVMWALCMLIGFLFLFTGAAWVAVIWFVAAICWAMVD
jgi:hypothetical protein